MKERKRNSLKIKMIQRKHNRKEEPTELPGSATEIAFFYFPGRVSHVYDRCQSRIGYGRWDRFQ